jgi:FkbM family methyltransferase
MVFINVGANKGFNVNTFLLRYGKGWSTTNAEWFAYLRSATPADSPRLQCGVCVVCNTTVLMRYEQADVQVLAVELMGHNARLLESAFAHFGVPGHVVHAAGGEAVGSTFEPHDVNSTMPGHERGKIAATGRRVPMVTVDSLIRKYNVNNVSILTIDAEGHDGAVLRGAVFTLACRIASVVEFEYNPISGSLWAHEKLGDTISTMTRYGYTCFWQSNSGLLSPFLPQCDYRFHRWSNVVCSHDDNILRALSMLVPERLRFASVALPTRPLRAALRGCASQ